MHVPHVHLRSRNRVLEYYQMACSYALNLVERMQTAIGANSIYTRRNHGIIGQ